MDYGDLKAISIKLLVLNTQIIVIYTAKFFLVKCCIHSHVELYTAKGQLYAMFIRLIVYYHK